MSLFAASLGLAALFSCTNSNSGDTASTINHTPIPSIVESDVISVKKEQRYMDGLNKSVDLSTFFEFKGSMPIDNIKFTFMGFDESEEITSLSGIRLLQPGMVSLVYSLSRRKARLLPLPSIRRQSIFVS